MVFQPDKKFIYQTIQTHFLNKNIRAQVTFEKLKF